MGSISSGIGFISGINSGQIIDQLMALEGVRKTTLQTRIASFTAQRTAILDINARLLALKAAASKLRVNKTFQSALATSSDEDVLTAAADATTPPGSYSFFVKRLASAAQMRSKAYATSDTTPLGLSQLTFAFGDKGIQRSIDLSSLNGGDGVRRGKIIITDKAGIAATIDLSDATTLDEVVERINDSETIAVTASIVGERLVLDDTSLGAGLLKVAENGGNTATDLGIFGTTAGTTITSSQIHRLGALTSLQSLNDGNGVLIRDGVADFKLQLDAGAPINISLGRTDAPITTATNLIDLNNGTGVKINTSDQADFKVITTDGQTIEVNLGSVVDSEGVLQDPAVVTVGDLIARVNSTLAAEVTGPGAVTLSIDPSQKNFVLTDTNGGAGALKVVGAGNYGDSAAKNLGIWTPVGAGPIITGSTVPNKVETPKASTIQDLMDMVYDQTGGLVTVTIDPTGTGLRFNGGASVVTVLPGSIDGSSFGTAVSERTARDLGIFGKSGTTFDSSRVLAGANTLLVNTLNGGAGLAGQNSLTLTDRLGNSVVVNSLNTYSTLEELVNAVNAAAAGAPTPVLANLSISSDNTSITVNDTSGGSGTLSVAGGAATYLGIAGTGGANDSFKGTNLQAQTLSLASSLSTMNYGKAIGSGTFRITDSTGAKAVVDIDASSTTLYDVIQEINSRGLAVEARLNLNGDGIDLVDTNAGSPVVLMKVEDIAGGVAAALGIKQTASVLGDDIAGSFDKTITLDANDTMKQVATKINAAGISVSASIVNTGTGAKPFYLSLASAIGGASGKLLIDSGGVDLGLATISEGRDGELLFGNSNPAEGLLLRSSTNVFSDVVGGLDITAKKASTDAVSVDVQRDTVTIKQSLKDLVTAFNDAVTRIDAYDSYDIDTKKKGILLGDVGMGTARGALYSTIQGRAKNVSGQYQFLSQVGMTVAKDGTLQFDEGKFDAAYSNDPQSVEKLFVTLEQQTVGASTPIPGVTIGSSKVVNTALGFSDLLDTAMKGLTDSIDGTLPLEDQGLQNVIRETNARIDYLDQRLAAKRAVLERQFRAMEDALGKMQTQQSALTGLYNAAKANQG